MVSKVKKVRDECVKDLKGITGYELMMRAVKFSNDVKKLIDNKTNNRPRSIIFTTSLFAFRSHFLKRGLVKL